MSRLTDTKSVAHHSKSLNHSDLNSQRRTSSNRYFRGFRLATIALCLMFLGLSSAQAQSTPDFQKLWTTVGSAGTVDEAHVSKVVMNHSTAQIGSILVNQPLAKKGIISVPRESALIRYNVTPVDGLFSFPFTSHGFVLRIRFLATDRGGVTAKLVEVDFNTGIETAHLLFNSGTLTGSAYQVSQGKCENISFDFKSKAYYVETKLTRPLIPGSAAGVQMIKIDNFGCEIVT